METSNRFSRSHTWEYLAPEPLELDQKYDFSGQFYQTAGVLEEIGPVDIFELTVFLRALVQAENGLDYLQRFRHQPTGLVVWVIDNLSREMLAGDGYTAEQKQENHYATILFPEEY